MPFVAVCDAWMADLTQNITGLTNATQHLYAPWSRERLEPDGQRHVAIWPEPGTEVYTPTVTQPAGFLVDTFLVVVWEPCTVEATRVVDDPVKEAAWLDLAEEIRARLFVLANQHLGAAGAQTDYRGGLDFGIQGTSRWMSLPFLVQTSLSFT